MSEGNETSAKRIEFESVSRSVEHLNAFSAILEKKKAPNDVDRLWEAIVSSPGTDFEHHASLDGLDEVLIETLANCCKMLEAGIQAGSYCPSWRIKLAWQNFDS